MHSGPADSLGLLGPGDLVKDIIILAKPWFAWTWASSVVGDVPAGHLERAMPYANFEIGSIQTSIFKLILSFIRIFSNC